jgi:PPOX class probable F420-dependent enzyme
MANKRSNITMSPEEIRDFLAGPRTMNIATIGPNGRPHLVAMWYGFTGGANYLTGQVCFWTFGKAQKILNLQRNPAISALVEDGTPDYSKLRGVELEGTGRIITDFDEIVQIALSTSSRYGGGGIVTPEARGFIEAQARKRVGVVIDVEKVVTWDHTKLGGAY